MPGLMPGIHDFPSDGSVQVVDGRPKPGHDGGGRTAVSAQGGGPASHNR